MDARLGLFLRQRELVHGEPDVVRRHQPRQEARLLEDITDQGLGRGIAAVNRHFSGGGRLQPAENVQNGGFAASGGTQNAEKFILRDIKTHVLESDEILAAACDKRLSESLYGDCRRCSQLLTGRGCVRSSCSAGRDPLSKLRGRPPVKHMALDLFEYYQLDKEHHERKEESPREHLGHIKKLEPVVKLKADPRVPA